LTRCQDADGTWQYVQSFNRDDLLLLAKAVDKE
jgi:hypothetical protein